MKCPDCGVEMEQGKVSVIMPMSAVMLSFVADSEAEKGIFKRKTHDATIIPGASAEAFYCPECGAMVPIIRK